MEVSTMAADEGGDANPFEGTQAHAFTGARVGVLATGAVVLLAALAWGLTFTSLFHAKVVSIHGAQKLSNRQIMSLAGVFPGVDVFHLDVGRAERSLETSPWVASASVTKHLPATVVISVTERSPVALVRDSSGNLLLVATDGVLLGPATGTEALPSVSQSDPSAIPDAGTVRVGASVAASLTTGLRTSTASIVVGSDSSIRVILRSGVVASYGTTDQLTAKGQALEAVLAWAARSGKKLAQIDVTVPSAPTATTAGGVLAAP